MALDNTGRVGPLLGSRSRFLVLSSDDYDWKVCLDPRDGHYVLFSELRPVHAPERMTRLVSQGFEVTVARSYILQSYLSPPF